MWYSTAKDWQITHKWVPFVLNYLELMHNTDVKNDDAEKIIRKVEAVNDIKKILADI